MHLLLCFHEHQDEPQVSWATFDAKKQLLETAYAVPLATVPRLATTVLIPSSSVLLTSAVLPTRQRQKMVQAIPYALEEQLAEEVENLHFALGQSDNVTGAVAVAVISRSLMNSYQLLLAQVGITAPVWLPEVLAVPLSIEGWGLLPFGERILVRTGIQSGFAIELSELPILLPIALAEHEVNPPKSFEVFTQSSSPALLQMLEMMGVPVIEHLDERGLLAWLVQGLSDTKGLNLLQGDYRPVSKISLLWRPWRLTIVLLLLWGLLQGGKLLIEYRQLNQQINFLVTKSEQIYRETFPESQRIVNPRVQMMQKLEALRNQQQTPPAEDFLTLLTQLTPALQQTAKLQLERLDYRQGRFDLLVLVTDIQVLEHLKQQWVQLGFSVDMQSVSNRQPQIEGFMYRVQIYNKKS